MQLYPNSYNFMIGCSGTYLVHPLPERILNETFFHRNTRHGGYHRGRYRAPYAGRLSRVQHDTERYSFNLLCILRTYRTDRMVGRGGMYIRGHFRRGGPYPSRCRGYRRHGVAPATCLCICTIRQQTLPLVRLAHAACHIARGDLYTPLPPLRKRYDEVGGALRFVWTDAGFLGKLHERTCCHYRQQGTH